MVVRREQDSYRILGGCELLSDPSYIENISNCLHPSCIPCVGRGGGVPSDIGVSVISHALDLTHNACDALMRFGNLRHATV